MRMSKELTCWCVFWLPRLIFLHVYNHAPYPIAAMPR
jgi:hypothetical protein